MERSGLVTGAGTSVGIPVTAPTTPFRRLRPHAPIAPSLLHERQYFLIIAQQRPRRCCSAKNISSSKPIELI